MEKEQPGPNVLIIHTDEHRFDCLGAYGNPDIRTPNIDALASDGMRYDNSFCPLPICTPSRYSMLSGLYVHEHQGFTNHCTLKHGTPTFATVLRDNGYKTKAIGKMHFTPTYLDVGFDEMLLCEQDGEGRWDDDYHRELKDNGLVDVNDLEDQREEYRKQAGQTYWDTFGAMPSNLPPKYHSTQWIGDKAAETLDKWGADGNLLMAGFVKPHHPFDPPKDMCGAYDSQKLALLPGWTDKCVRRDQELSGGYFPNEKLTEAAYRRVLAYYYAAIEHIDMQVGRMVDILKKKDIYEDTLIIFTADHGDYMGFNHMLLKANYMYDPVVKVPLIIKFPNESFKGTNVSALVNNIDIAPTIISAAGLDSLKEMRGRDLAKGGVGPDMVFGDNWESRQLMARSQTRKLIQTIDKKKSLFFDLEQDPLERTDLYGDPAYQEEVKALEQAITEWRGEQPAKPYLNEDEQQIKGSNVPEAGSSHREEMKAYFKGKMSK